MVSRGAVLGAGSWGTTVAALLAPVVSTVLWARRTELADDLNAGRGNERYLPGFDLPPDLEATADLGEATSGAALVLVAVPPRDSGPSWRARKPPWEPPFRWSAWPRGSNGAVV